MTGFHSYRVVLLRLREYLARLTTVHPHTHTQTSCADTSVAYYVRTVPELKVRLWRDNNYIRNYQNPFPV